MWLCREGRDGVGRGRAERRHDARVSAVLSARPLDNRNGLERIADRSKQADVAECDISTVYRTSMCRPARDRIVEFVACVGHARGHTGRVFTYTFAPRGVARSASFRRRGPPPAPPPGPALRPAVVHRAHGRFISYRGRPRPPNTWVRYREWFRGLLLIGASVLFIVSYVMKFPRSRRVSGFLWGYFLRR